MKRGSSGLSLVVGVDKPQGMSSHDVVNRCRRIFGERRVGHTGTLDPLATGALLVCVGPATRLDAHLVGHDKRYRVRVAFGFSTTTDDAAGEPMRFGEVPPEVLDPAFAAITVARFLGKQKQLPPVYSALKVGGKKACDEARAGRVIDLAPRDIEVFSAEVVAVGEGSPDGGTQGTSPDVLGDGTQGAKVPQAAAWWDIDFHVSSGTYIRSLARDIGLAVGCPAHVSALRRVQVGALSLDECVTLETLEEVGTRAALDPVKLLGFRFLYASGHQGQRLANGGALSARDAVLFEQRYPGVDAQLCACTSGVCESTRAPEDGEVVSVISENRLAALYAYDAQRGCYKAKCVFPTGVVRSGDL